MNSAAKVGAFAAALAAVFAAAFFVGRGVGPVDNHVTASQESMASTAMDVPGGLMVSKDGYTLELRANRADAGKDVPVAFQIVGPDGDLVTQYEVEHDKRLHFIAVRRDLTGFQHVHPALGKGGTWTTNLDLRPGDWRVFADFKPTGGLALTLGVDLAVPGQYAPRPDPAVSRTSSIDGYNVTLDGTLKPEQESTLTLRVSKGGKPVDDLQPYLGAYGHLVALRAGDLAYLHVHPQDMTTAGPDITFDADVPSVGTYGLFLNFKHGGVVHTASFVLDAARHSTGDSGPVGVGSSEHGGH